MKYLRWAGWLCAMGLLSACETTGPQVNENAAAGSLACRVGPESATRSVPVQAWRGREASLQGYTTQKICQRLEQVSQQLQSQGVSLRFELMGAVQEQPTLGQANNAAMQTAVTGANGHLQGHLALVVVDTITQCGGASGLILGCTPQIGWPLVYLMGHRTGTPEWVIWAHEMGHTVGLGHPDSQFSPTTFPQRIMTYMPMPQSTTLVPPEPEYFPGMGLVAGGGGAASGAAVGTKPEATEPAPLQAVAVQDLIPFVLRTGQHGLPLAALAHLDDAALLTLRVLLEPPAGIDNALLARMTEAVRINALVPLAELGRNDAQAYVRGYLLRQTGSAHQNVRRYGLWALGRGQLRHPTPETRVFLENASEPGFWCAGQSKDSADCAALASAAQEALREFADPKRKPTKP